MSHKSLIFIDSPAPAEVEAPFEDLASVDLDPGMRPNGVGIARGAKTELAVNAVPREQRLQRQRPR